MACYLSKIIYLMNQSSSRTIRAIWFPLQIELSHLATTNLPKSKYLLKKSYESLIPIMAYLKTQPFDSEY